MAVPTNVTTKAFSGRYHLNKSLSDDPDEILRLQGVSWFKRRAISLFSVTIYLEHTTDEAGIEHFYMDQFVSGIPGAREEVTLDGRERDIDHFIFGFLTTKMARIPIDELTDEYLRKDLAPDCIEGGVVLTESWSTPGKNSHTWKNSQVWGFAMVNGERRYVTQITFTSPLKDGPIHARFVYDHVGAV